MDHIAFDSFTLWLYYPSLIKLKIKQRNLLDKIDENYLLSTINASLIIDMATFWEGIVCEMQMEIFNERLGSKDKFQKSLNQYFDRKLAEATWYNYIDYFEILLGEKLITKFDNENWKAINMLFQFRNMLVHGKEIDIRYFVDNKMIHVDSPYGFKKIFDFLKEKKLLDLSFSPYLNSVDMLNDSVVDFFYNQLITFIDHLFDVFPESEVGELRTNFNACLTY